MSIALFPLSFYNICILFILPFHFIHFYLSFISIWRYFLWIIHLSAVFSEQNF